MENTTHGGQRKNSGRKPSDDPKEPITVFIEGSIIKRKGGKDIVKKKTEKFIREELTDIKTI